MNLPKIGIIGYGSMGREIHKLCLDNDLTVTDTIDVDNKLDINKDYNFDVAIDFSNPEAVLESIKILTKKQKAIVIGTTGWEKHKAEVIALAKETNTPLIYGSNFSLGMQLFYRIVEYSSKLINQFDGFDIMINEMHHNNKADSPSGTALNLANIILNNYAKKSTVLAGNSNGKISSGQLQISSGRLGTVCGTHNILIDTSYETINLSHEAKNRRGFAGGAILAAKWIYGKSGIYNFSELIDLILTNNDINPNENISLSKK